MLLRDDYGPFDPLPPITVTPGQWAKRVAYRIDPLMGNRVVVVQPAYPCRIDGELDAADLWKSRPRLTDSRLSARPHGR
jgi:hypothetical protein